MRKSYDLYANTYNPGWWNHPNSSWQSQNYGVTFNPYLRDNETILQTQPSRKKSLEEAFQAFMESTTQITTQTRNELKELRNSIERIESHLSAKEHSIVSSQVQPKALASKD